MAFTHHVGHRDSQRSKVYNGEAEFWATRPGEHLVTPSKAAEQLTDCYRQSRARVARDWRIAI
jgi:hypothetical protein